MTNCMQCQRLRSSIADKWSATHQHRHLMQLPRISWSFLTTSLDSESWSMAKFNSRCCIFQQCGWGWTPPPASTHPSYKTPSTVRKWQLVRSPPLIALEYSFQLTYTTAASSLDSGNNAVLQLDTLFDN